MTEKTSNTQNYNTGEHHLLCRLGHIGQEKPVGGGV